MLIALCSNGRQAGKDTVADMIGQWADQCDIPFRRVAFADKMKQFVGLTLGMSGETDIIKRVDDFKLHGEVGIIPNKDLCTSITRSSGRDLIISISEAAKEIFGPHFWIDQVLTPPDVYINAHLYFSEGLTLVTDMRFPLEFDRVRSLHGGVIKITRPGAEGGRSENLLDNYDCDRLIENNSDLADLNDKVIAAMEGIYSFHA